MLTDNNICPEITLAVGRLFYAKVYPVLTYKKDGTSSLSFINDYKFPEHSSTTLSRFWYILLFIIIVFIIIFAIMKIKNKSEVSVDQEDGYQTV